MSNYMHTVGSPAYWIGFLVFVLAMLALDLGVFNRHAHVVKVKEALVWSLVWVGCAAAFGVLVYFAFGSQRAFEFATGYVIEKALSVDNLFVFVVLFTTFQVPQAQQHRVLFWGVLGALIMRAIFIAAGAVLLERFHWLMYVFGAFLLFTAFKLAREKSDHPQQSPLEGRSYRALVRFLPTTSHYEGDRFFTKLNGRNVATPLFVVLVLVEVTDLIFAVDSIPAVFAVTTDPFIVFTSNVFAILGLRALYFVLADFVHRFHYLKPALAIVLGFVGVKMLIMDLYKIPILLSLGVIIGTLTGAILLSRAREKRLARTAASNPPPHDSNPL
ncbi:MAG TPA: TerC family protein, partial [Polyangiaceae bacterium]|nr:TerC family protein [Polyangiaceae bacterium]